MAAGAIIGKGGETIAQLQKETGARVKMSKANDFYPGTSSSSKYLECVVIRCYCKFFRHDNILYCEQKLKKI